MYRGRIIAERYAPGWGPYTPQISWSMGKSIAATLIGVLVQQGALAVDQPAPLAEWSGARDPRRAIRVADLLRMSSGLDFDNFGLNPATSYVAANEHFRIYFDAVDVAAHSVNQPLRFEPGTVWRYRNSDPLSLMAIARRIVEARGEDFLRFPQRALFDRIGARSFVLETDAWGSFIITGFDYGGTRDWARFGLLYLRGGQWDGQQLLPAGWVDETRVPSKTNPEYGLHWWLNEDGFSAEGLFRQRIVVVPELDLVIATNSTNGGDPDPMVRTIVEQFRDA